jgi:hypothetical protein
MRRLACVGFAVLSLAGCLTKKPPAPVPEAQPAPPPPTPVVSPWPAILASARRAAEARRYADAERILVAFAAEHPKSEEGWEATFWRALFQADPANHDATVREELAAFDAYLTGGPALPRYEEALVLRRMVEAVDSTRTVIIAVRAAADARDRGKNDEVRRLSDELEKTVAELERVRRRLVPKPPEQP